MTVQRVVITRTGGFANIRRSAEVDDPAAAQRLSTAVRDAAAQPPGPARDDFVYEFVIVMTTTTDQFELTGAQLTGELRPTVHALFQR